MEPHNSQQQWDLNKRAHNKKLREFSTEFSEFSWLFQRVVMRGNTTDKADLKTILRGTNQKLIRLLDEIDGRDK